MLVSEILLCLGLASSLGANGYCLYHLFVMRKRFSHVHTSGRALKELGIDLAGLKREQNLLNDNFHRFRIQSLEGITETINESIQTTVQPIVFRTLKDREGKFRESVTAEFAHELNGKLENFSSSVEKALNELHSRLEEVKRAPLAGNEPDSALTKSIDQIRSQVDAYSFELEQLNDKIKRLPAIGGVEESNKLLAIDFFLATLEEPEDRRRCFLSALENVHDPATLGKLAVAYPTLNSWLILKELAHNSIVSEVGGWALLTGATILLIRVDGDKVQNRRMAYELLQAARQSFQAVASGHHDGLYCTVSLLVVLEQEDKRDAVALLLSEQAQNHLRHLKSNKPAELCRSCLQLANFYIGERKFTPAVVLMSFLMELNIEVFADDYDRLRDLWQNFAYCLFEHYKVPKNFNCFDFLSPRLLEGIKSAITDSNLHLSGEVEEDLLFTLMLYSSSKENIAEFKDAAEALLDLKLDLPALGAGQKEAGEDKFNMIMEALYDLMDKHELWKLPSCLGLASHLSERFMKTSNFTQAANCAAKVVDAQLEAFGESAEAIVPMTSLAGIYKKMQRNDLAEECYRRILEMQYKIFTAEDPSMVDVLLNLAEVCLSLHDEGEAEIFLESAFEMIASLYPDENDALSSADMERRDNLMVRAIAVKEIFAKVAEE
jgi:tetratricopeptide (TPR) repeat protein